MQDTLVTSLRTELRWAVSDALVMAKRNLIRYVRLPQLLVFSTIQPVMFVLLFAFVFGGAIATGGVEYIDLLVPGVLVQTAMFGTVQTGVGLAEDLATGLIDRYRSLPMARSAVVAGRILADTVRNVFVVLLMIGVGSAIGFRFGAGVQFIVPVVLIAVLFGHAFSWVSAFIGASVRDVETAQVAGFVWIFPLTFLSSTFVPIETMPVWLQPIAENNPVTSVVDTLRGLSHGWEVTEPLIRTLAWTVGILAVFATLAVTRYRRLS